MMQLFTIAVLVLAVKGDFLTVPTSSGILKGKLVTVLDKSVKAFLGVPYARAPIDDLRFKPPVAFVSEGVEQNAQHFAPVCYQPAHAAEVISPLLKPNQAEISEDCLYLNVYVPTVQSDDKLPVMIWLAGEGFNYADPVQFDGKYLAAQGNVIIVTVSYRVSVFGFLSARHLEAPGNVGLLDQRAAMQWVKKNIAHFGGDADHVTLFGRFSGSMSAAIHAFSPFSKREILFNRVILMSGVPDGDWIFDPNPLNATLALAEVTNCVYSSVEETVACLKRLPANILLKAALPIPDAWRPIIDSNVVYEHTLKAAAETNYNPIDVLIGLNRDEGSLCLTALKARKSPFFGKILDKTLTKEDLLELIDNSMFDVYNEKDDALNKLVAFQYSDDDESKLRDRYVEFCGDLYVAAHSQKLADVVSGHSRRVFMYELSHRPTFSIQPSFIEAAHGDDVLYALGLPLSLKLLPEEEEYLTKEVVESVSSFAYTGNPNADNSTMWPAYTTEHQLLMNFDTQTRSSTVRKSTHEKAVQFWHDIIPSMRQRTCPYPPVASSLVDVPDHQGPAGANQAYFLSKWIAPPTVEYMMLGLVCVSSFLLFTTFMAIVVMFRVKQHATFCRLN